MLIGEGLEYVPTPYKKGTKRIKNKTICSAYNQIQQITLLIKQLESHVKDFCK